MPSIKLPMKPEGWNRPQACIAPSILSSDFANLSSECQRMLDCGADWLHVDIMDGHFVPNLTLGAPIVKSLRKHTTGFLDCHLMVTNPKQWVKDFASAGADMYTFHIEAVVQNPAEHTPEAQAAVKQLCQEIRDAGMYVGVSVKPDTPVESVFHYVEEGLIDLVLVMTVEPGFGGQKFNAQAVQKCTTLRQHFPNLQIEVDGGLALDTIEAAAAAGANVIVAGTAVFGSSDPAGVIAGLRSSIDTAASKAA